ncbi:MAG: DUF1566 domain-containing protein [Sedimenticola sp.]
MHSRLLRALSICIFAIGLISTADAALVLRLNGQAVYDTDLDITWLADARAGGHVNWVTANNWATSLSFGGYGDWRLPTAPSSGTCSGYNCSDSEMGHMFYNELTGSAGTVINSSNAQWYHDPDLALFTNLYNHYWTSTESEPTYYWNFSFAGGYQGTSRGSNSAGAWAVRDGDVNVVPIPAAVWLFGTGLMGLIGFSKRKKAA